MSGSETPKLWPQPDGAPVSCTEKLVVLRQNWEELRDVMRDAFEDAVLMGVDEAEMRRLIVNMATDLASPRVESSS